MEVNAESGGNIEFNSQNGSLSLGDGGDDSNALLLPSKIGKKRKGLNQVHGEINSYKKHKLSKSQKRKLQKLEEEKEKEFLLKRSIETLNKYKIPEYAYPLLQSTQAINRTETVLERRRKAIHLLKEGLGVDHSHDLSGILDVLHGVEPEAEEIHMEQETEENDQIHPARFERDLSCEPYASMGSSQEPACGDESFKNNETVTTTLGGVSVEKTTSLVDDKTHCDDIGKPIDGSIRAESKDGTCEISKTNLRELRNLNDSSASTTPTVVHVYRPAEVQDKRKDLL